MIALKPYTSEYESTLAEYVIAFWDVHHSTVPLEEAKETLSDWTKGNHRLFAILRDQTIVGFIRTHNTSPTVCWIDDIYVDAPFRSQGIATEAIHQVETALRAEGSRSFCMEVVPDNLPAMRLYHHLGYDRLSLITMRKDDDPFEAARTETIANLPMRVRKFD